ncbi:thioredoxin [Xanthovirga aplysinae]|uniref:thioredoxin n=1 Tax=Xanthovirga aplysinae TaxID=2529853 RepID=UPI0012BC5594|nr:thioredoxin [Xanthovirga aplysinae]MTI29953.1 thioredoxin [Xanthovirga aplysinae]
MTSFNELINSNTPVLVDFTADWCGPCQMMTPVLQEIAGEIGEKAKIIKVDVDKNPQAADAFEVRGVPTFILFKKGEIKWRHSGAVPGIQLKEVIEAHCS